MIYDIWYMIYDIWYMIYDIWYMIYDVYDDICIYDIWYICIYIYIYYVRHFNERRVYAESGCMLSMLPTPVATSLPRSTLQRREVWLPKPPARNFPQFPLAGMFWGRAPLHSNPFGEVFTPKQPCEPISIFKKTQYPQSPHLNPSEIGEFLQLSTQDVGPYVDPKFIMFIFQAVTIARGEALPEELSAKLLASWSS